MSNLNVDGPEDLNSSNSNNSTTQNNAEIESDLESSEHTNTEKAEQKEPRSRFGSQSVYAKMYILCRELCFLLVLFVSYAAFHSTSPKVSKSPIAFPFFPAGSVVKDWYRGHLTEPIERASESDIAFVMYYAPWDAESQSVRREFDIVAQHMHKYIHFAAINCWHPGSECRHHYNKVYSWPVLMVYPVHGRGIQYRGPRTAEHMMQFLRNVAMPLVRVTSNSELSMHEATQDAVVIAYLDASVGSANYGVYYSASLLFLERDPLREILFAVETGHNPVTYSVHNFPMLQLRLWNETLIYPEDNKWNPESIISWINDRLHQLSIWASLPGGKSQSLAQYVLPGPALILFTPRNPLNKVNDYYLLLHEIAKEYCNCQSNIRILLHKTLILLKRKENYLKYKKTIDQCSLKVKPKQDKFPTVITYDMPKVWSNNTCSVKDKLSLCVESKIKKDTCSKVVHTYPSILRREYLTEDSESDYKIVNASRDSTQYTSAFKTSMLTGELDPLSPANLVKFTKTEDCRFAKISHTLQPPVFTTDVLETVDEIHNISGMTCKTNMSLTILALDSLQLHHFAEALGIDIFNKADKSAVVIINPPMETHHVMQEPYNGVTIRKFIKDFTNGVLNRMLSSTEIPRKHTHHYKHSDTCHSDHSEDLCIQELTTATFLPAVMQTDVSVIIFYYSAKCAFCSGVSHTMLSVARVLSQVSNVQFTRIDGDSHALPWEYAMHHYPTILFFPSQRKSESRAFPQNVPITVPNVLSFILANVEPKRKLHIMWVLCKQAQFEADLHACSRTVRIESLSIIGRTLREYRSSTNIRQRNHVLKFLQRLRSLQFLLVNPSKNIGAIDSALCKLNRHTSRQKRKECL